MSLLSDTIASVSMKAPGVLSQPSFVKAKDTLSDAWSEARVTKSQKEGYSASQESLPLSPQQIITAEKLMRMNLTNKQIADAILNSTDQEDVGRIVWLRTEIGK